MGSPMNNRLLTIRYVLWALQYRTTHGALPNEAQIAAAFDVTPAMAARMSRQLQRELQRLQEEKTDVDRVVRRRRAVEPGRRVDRAAPAHAPDQHDVPALRAEHGEPVPADLAGAARAEVQRVPAVAVEGLTATAARCGLTSAPCFPHIGAERSRFVDEPNGPRLAACL